MSKHADDLYAKGKLQLAYRTPSGHPVYDVGLVMPAVRPEEKGIPWDKVTGRTPYVAVIGVGTVTMKPI